jgi:GR25 family glycosyltransferase involved in LPS biosynthesis
MTINFSEILGIDKVYCISLAKNKAKWDDILKYIKSNGFPNCTIFEAVNGTAYSSQNLENMVGVWQRYILKNNLDRTNHEQFNKFGAIGCYLSHVAIWQEAKTKGYKKILIWIYSNY